MENKIYKTLKSAMDELDSIADTYGVARASHITLLANTLLEIKRAVGDLTKELDELRKFKEEHTENDDKRNEVPAES